MITLRNVSKALQEKQVLDHVSFSINSHEVAVLIGKNGAGKTTLLRLIADDIQPDDGEIIRYQGRIGYVPQEPFLGKDILSSFPVNAEQWRLDCALDLVGLLNISTTTPTSQLSGGQRTRLAIARVLADEAMPTTLLLDEPTNHLDQSGVKWLKRFIRLFKGAVFCVSHDRAFINDIATTVIELENGHTRQYNGNYDFYKEQKVAELYKARVAFAAVEDEKKRLVTLQKHKIGMVQQTSQQSFSKTRDESKMRFHSKKNSAQSNIGKQLRALDQRLRQLEEIELPKIPKEYPTNLFGEVPGSKLILKLEDVSKVYTKTVVSGFNLEIRGNERIRMDGPNGSGKTTLLKIMAGLLTPTSGELTIGANVSIGYFSQDSNELDQTQTGFESLSKEGASHTAIHSTARTMGLNANDLHRLIALLSRGQQAKLAFIELLLDSHQLLVLDEPTNHLDITARENIESALKVYKGAVVVVSHDEYFLAQINTTKTVTL